MGQWELSGQEAGEGAPAISTASSFGVCCWLFIGNRRGSLSGQEESGVRLYVKLLLSL